ncbi:MAG: flagellar biosynthesis protein FlhB [Candidatus Sedimenticola sp. (ex Thyasira tokunagai)]
MAEDSQEQDKTEKATPYKLREAKKRGQVAKSQEATSFFLLSLALGATYLVSEEAILRLLDICRLLLSQAHKVQFEVSYLIPMGQSILLEVLSIVSLPIVVLMVGGVLSNIIQTGPVFSFFPLKPDVQRINPVAGFKRLFSLKLIFEAVKSVFKIAAFSAVTYFTVYALMPKIMGLLDSAPERSAVFILAGGKELVFKLLLVIFLIALLDFLYTRWDFSKKMRMSKRDQKEEVKRREGDPKIRARIRELQQEAAKRAGSLSKVPEADVLITNPTHFSIAIKYNRDNMIAPEVTAKGAGDLALKMRQIARESDVPIIENKRLARKLFKMCSIQQAVPEKLYSVIAKILIKVYSQKDQSILAH